MKSLNKPEDFFEEYKQAKISELQKNVENLSEFKKRFSSEGVTETKITYSYFYGSDNILSFIMLTSRGVNPENADPSAEAVTFSLANGNRLTLESLYTADVQYREELLKSKIRVRAGETYSENGAPLSESQIEALDSLFDNRNFVCTDDSIVFL